MILSEVTGKIQINIDKVIYIYAEVWVVVIKLRGTRGSNCSSRAELARLESCNYCLKCRVIWLLLPKPPRICITIIKLSRQNKRNLCYVIHITLSRGTYNDLHITGKILSFSKFKNSHQWIIQDFFEPEWNFSSFKSMNTFFWIIPAKLNSDQRIISINPELFN